MSKNVNPENLPYGTKLYVNGEYKGFVYFPKGDVVEKILCETTDGKITKLGLRGKNDEEIMMTIASGKVVSIDFKKADGRVFSKDIPA